MSLRVGIPQIGMRASRTPYQVMEAAATEAARRNNAALWYVGNNPDGWVYEDSTGTTAATGTDPVGLLLDRSYGPNNFGTSLAPAVTAPNWLLGTGTSISGNIFVSVGFGSGGEAQIRPSTAPPVIVGKYYKLTFTVTKTGGGDLSIGIGGVSGTTRTSSGTYTEIVQATTTGNLNVLSRGPGGFIGTVGDIYAAEVLGYPALQATAANKPTLELQANGYYGMRFDGVNDGLAISGPNLVSSAYSMVTSAAYGGTISVGVVGGTGNTTNSNALIGQRAVVDANTIQFGQYGNDIASPGSYSRETPLILSGIRSLVGRSLYVNGALVATDSNTTLLVSNANSSIGGNSGSGRLTGLAWLVCVSANAIPDADRAAIERFAALLSGASYV